MKRITSFNLSNIIKPVFGLSVMDSNWLLFKIILPVRLYTLTSKIHLEKLAAALVCHEERRKPFMLY